MDNNKITFVFDDEEDAKSLIDDLDAYTEIKWDKGTKTAMIKVIKKDNRVLVSKSVYNPPKPLKL